MPSAINLLQLALCTSTWLAYEPGPQVTLAIMINLDTHSIVQCSAAVGIVIAHLVLGVFWV